MASEAIQDQLTPDYATEQLQRNAASTNESPNSERGVSVRGGRFDNSASANNNLSINLLNLVFGGGNDVASSGLRTEYPSLTYSRLLLSHACGFPLYDPQPPGWLSADYKREGVRIGDVGIVHTDGYFDFLFNIRYPADHPVNGGNAPEGFSPPAWASSIVDVSQTNDTRAAGTYFSNGSVEVLPGLPERAADNFSFRGKPGEGAVLVLPSSTVIAQEPLVKRFRDYAGENALSWYEFATGPLERDLSNGSIYLITGWEKTSQWGTASFQGNNHEFNLSFENTGWTNHGVAAVHRGPRGRTGSNETSLPPNQCIFLRGYKATIGQSLWDRLQGTIEVTDMRESRTTNYSSRSLSGNPSTTPGVMSRMVRSWFYGSRGGVKEDEIPVEIESTSISTVDAIHPSNIINRYLLDKIPDATVAVTHDDDWCSLIKLKGSGGSVGDDYFDSEYEVVSEGGVVFLERKGKCDHEVADTANPVDPIKFNPLVPARTSVYKATPNRPRKAAPTLGKQIGITSLPSDVLVFIFLRLDFRSILSFSSTCRTLWQIMHNFQAIEYSLMLDSSSLIDNSSVANGLPLCNMSITDKLALLKAREEGWSSLEVGWEEKVELQHAPSGIYDLADGVYILGNADRRSVHWTRLPDGSNCNEGKKPKWNTIKFNERVIDLVLNVYEHDLLAVMTSRESPNDPAHVVLSLHLLSLSRSTSGLSIPHPKAQQPVLHIQESLISHPCVGIDIVGRHLVLTTFHPANTYHSEYHLHFIEWKTGRVKLHLRASSPVFSYASHVFLKEDIVLIPNVDRRRLDIWRIPDDGGTASTTPIRSLALPEVATDCYIASIACRGWPNPVGSAPASPFSSKTENEAGWLRELHSNRPFHANPAESIVIFNIRVRMYGFGLGDSTTFTMFVHRSTLLELASEQPNDMPNTPPSTDESDWVVRREDEERGESDVEDMTGRAVSLPQHLEDRPPRPTNKDRSPEPLSWEEWGGPDATRWFVSEETPTRWITTSAGQRAVIYDKESRTDPGAGASVDDECVVKILDFSPVRIRKEECLARRRKVERREEEITKQLGGQEKWEMEEKLRETGMRGEAWTENTPGLQEGEQFMVADNTSVDMDENGSCGACGNGNDDAGIDEKFREGDAVERSKVPSNSAPNSHTPTTLLGSLSNSPPRVIREPSRLIHERFKEPIVSHLPYSVVETRKLPKFTGMLMDEERLIGLSTDEEDKLESVWVMGIGATEDRGGKH